MIASPVPRRPVAFVWAGFALLLLIGTVAAALRTAHIGDLYAVMEPLRTATLAAFGIPEPNALRRAEVVARIDAKFAAHVMATQMHVGFGALFFVLVPLQFSKSLRAQHRALHRWSGRLLVVVAWITGLGGLYFGVLHPFAGPFERLIIGLVGSWFLAATSIAFVRIRQGRTAEHREWMLRAVAAALGISTVRLVATLLDVVLTPYGVAPEVIFLHSFWIGWGVMLLAAERWIRRTRHASPSGARYG